MIVLLLENVPASLRGELSRWFIEARTGVFVGRVSAQVRDLVWENVCEKIGTGGGLMVYTTNTEQGYDIRSWGTTAATVRNWEGLKLIQRELSPQDLVTLSKEERSWERDEEITLTASE